jgi:hypothetical protein
METSQVRARAGFEQSEIAGTSCKEVIYHVIY